MKKTRRPQPSVPAPPPASIGNLTLKLEPDANLRVTIPTPEKPPQPLSRSLRWFIAVFATLFVLWGGLNAFYVIRTEDTTQPVEFDDARVAVAITYPTYVTFRDDLDLVLNIANRGAEDFTGNVTIVFQGAVPAYPLPAESATAKIEKLAPGAGHSHRLKFALRQKPPWIGGGTINTLVRVATNERSFQPKTGPTISVAHVTLPLRTINAWLGNSVVLGVIAALIWEVVRKRLLGWEAK
jgi:hypothetical protein